MSARDSRVGSADRDNGVLFAASNGAIGGGKGRSVLYALDAATGNSCGTAARDELLRAGVPPSAATARSMSSRRRDVYAFGIPLEH